MAARLMVDGGWQNDPPRLGRRAARRARSAVTSSILDEAAAELEAELEAELDSVFDDAEFEQLFGDLQLGTEDWLARRAEFEQRFNDLAISQRPVEAPRAPAPPPAPRPREPAAARLDRRDSVARAAASLYREDRPAEHVRRANSELQRLHAMRDPPAHSRDEAQNRHQALSREPDRWDDDFVGVPMDYEQRANCGICFKKKRLAKFSLANCGHGCCRSCVKRMEDAGREECPFCRSHVHTYCRAKHWPHAEHLDRLLASQAAMNPYTIY